MKTVVYQSYRTHDVPDWIGHCMETVRSWARSQGYDYHFFDDRFFDLLPTWFRECLAGRILPMTDLARLKAAQSLFVEGYWRAIWVDADVVIFDPERFSVDTQYGYAFCREVWLEKRWGTLVSDQRVNNCVIVLQEDNSFLDFYIHACEALARSAGARLTDWDLGTNFLSNLGRLVPLPLLTGVGMLSPAVIQALVEDDQAVLARFATDHGHTLSAGNMCGSASEKLGDSGRHTQEVLAAAFGKLLESRGQILNRHLIREVILPARKSPGN
jgi:hypothetical protein